MEKVELTLKSTVLLKNVVVSQLVKKFPAFHRSKVLWSCSYDEAADLCSNLLTSVHDILNVLQQDIFNIALSFTPRSPKWPLPFKVFDWTEFLICPCVLHRTPSCRHWFDHRNKTYEISCGSRYFLIYYQIFSWAQCYRTFCVCYVRVYAACVYSAHQGEKFHNYTKRR